MQFPWATVFMPWTRFKSYSIPALLASSKALQATLVTLEALCQVANHSELFLGQIPTAPSGDVLSNNDLPNLICDVTDSPSFTHINMTQIIQMYSPLTMRWGAPGGCREAL